MSRRRVIYISGPMTGIKSKNYPNFNQAAYDLRERGYQVVNPAELDIDLPQSTWEECLRRDIRELMRCNAVATLSGWQKSKGATFEAYIAKTLGWPVKPVKFYLTKTRQMEALDAIYNAVCKINPSRR